MTNYEITMSKLNETKMEAQKIIDKMNKAINSGRRVEQCQAAILEMEIVLSFNGTDDESLKVEIGNMASGIIHKTNGWECAEPKKFYRTISLNA